MAEKHPQVPTTCEDDGGNERTVVDARVDSARQDIEAPTTPPWEDETVDGRQRRNPRASTAPIDAPGDGSGQTPSKERFVELSSGDLIEERTDRAAAPLPHVDTDSDVAPTPRPPDSSDQQPTLDGAPESINEQPTLIYRDESAVQPKLVVIGGNDRGHEFILGAAEVTVGRGTDCDVILADIAVSRRHVLLQFDGSRVLLRDLQSGNGTLVNGKRSSGCTLRDGDQIELGNTLLRFVYPVEEHPADATEAADSVTAEGHTPSAGDRPSPAAGTVGGTPMFQPRPAPPSLRERAAAVWSWLQARMTETRARIIAGVGIGLVLIGVATAILHRSSRGGVSSGGDAEQLFESGVRAFRVNRWQEARDTFAKVLALAPDNPKARMYVERCDMELASGRALDEARRALAEKQWPRVHAALDRVDVASFAFEDARQVRAELEKAERATAAVAQPRPQPKPPRPEPQPEPASAQPKPPPRPIKVASRASHPHPKPLAVEPPEPAATAGVDKTAIAHYKNREWGAAAAAIKGPLSDQVRRVGTLWAKAEMDRSVNLPQAMKEYDDALALDKKLPFSKGYHAPYLIAQLQKLSRAAATAAYAAGNFEQAYLAAHAAQKYSPNDPALSHIFQDLDAKAREFVSRGLTLKETNAEQAKLLFRRVLKFTDTKSVTYQKAYQALNSMARPQQDEDE